LAPLSNEVIKSSNILRDLRLLCIPFEELTERCLRIFGNGHTVVKAEHREREIEEAPHAPARLCRVIVKLGRDKLQLFLPTMHQQIRTKEHPRLSR
jgi:hypothetical protein